MSFQLYISAIPNMIICISLKLIFNVQGGKLVIIYSPLICFSYWAVLAFTILIILTLDLLNFYTIFRCIRTYLYFLSTLGSPERMAFMIPFRFA